MLALLLREWMLEIRARRSCIEGNASTAQQMAKKMHLFFCSSGENGTEFKTRL